MKLHLPLFFRKSVLSCLTLVAGYTLSSGTLAFADDLVLGAENTLSIDYAAADSIPDLENGTLQLDGDALLQLLNCGLGDGKTYELFTGVTRLVDAAGNTITLDSSNNAISNYFDTTQPGTGFWADATLQLSADGILRLVRHSEAVKPAVTITTRQTGDVDYQYYEGVHFADIEYTSNSSSAYGGAIYGYDGSTITLSDNGSVTFSGNTASSSDASACGGAIYGDTITLSDNGSVTFSGNTASSTTTTSYSPFVYGGAIYGGTITLSNNGSVVFEGNTASSTYSYACGGAIYGSVTMTDNGSVEFIGNSASSDGGAIMGPVTMTNNGSVTFIGNTAASDGAAIDGSVTMTGNDNVEFIGNSALNDGGAIEGSVTMTDNGCVVFRGNTAADGGAMQATDNLSICNNDSVLFEKNAEVSNGSYRLRSIQAWCYEDAISLSSAAGSSIEFRDSVEIDSGFAVNLNADYTDADGETHKQQGDIIFTGKYTETHLNELLATAEPGRTASAEEILASRTTEVNALTNLYGGRLRVEDGAIYQGQGITVHEDSQATVRVKDAELSHVGYNLTFNDGTALEVAGESTIRGLVNLQEGSVFKLEQGATLNLYETNGDALSVGGLAWLEGASTLNADLTLAEGSTLDIVSLDAGAVALNGVLTFGGQVTLGENLLALLDEKLGHESSITLFTGLENVDWATVTGNAVSDCVWAGTVFSNMAGNHSCYLNYASDTGSLVMQIVPEPATATLSLLALAALAARRRRN